MKIHKFIPLINIFWIILLTGCYENNDVEKVYYDDGSLMSKIHYKDGVISKLEFIGKTEP